MSCDPENFKLEYDGAMTIDDILKPLHCGIEKSENENEDCSSEENDNKIDSNSEDEDNYNEDDEDDDDDDDNGWITPSKF